MKARGHGAVASLDVIWNDLNRLGKAGKLSGRAAADAGKPAATLDPGGGGGHGTKHVIELGQVVARSFHWVLGITIIGMIAYGWWMNHFPARADRFFYRSIHADIGYAVLLLMVLRLIWRGVNPTPALPADSPPWQRIVARISHSALYPVPILVAMLGWAIRERARQNYSSFFGLVHVPEITSPDKVAARFVRRSAHLLRLCAAGADRQSTFSAGALASFHPARPGHDPDGRWRAGLNFAI